MGWFEAGPGFILAPRNDAYVRLSRRNEKGRQTVVRDIAIDPTYNPATAGAQATVYIVEARGFGSNAWRSDDDGATWTSIADTLRQQLANPYIDPSCVAINPAQPNIVYLGTASRGFYVSSNRGAAGTWSASVFAAENRKVIVDARSAANAATTVLYAARSTGLFRSTTGGSTWDATPVVAGNVSALAGHFDPTIGAAHVYAVAGGVGAPALYYSTNPGAAANWTNLSAAGIGLPTPTPGTYDAILVDVCRRNPFRAYAWFLNNGTTVGIYTTASPTTAWTQVPAVGTPNGRFDTQILAITPGSPGDGLTDVLAFGTDVPYRSTDAGRTWSQDVDWLHVDHHAFAFAPVDPAPGTIPVTYAGCDGGLGKSSRFADPTVAIDVAPSSYNETSLVQDTATWQNCNRGRQSVHHMASATVRGQPALTYLASWDSGVKAGDSSRTWRAISDGDVNAVAAAAGPGGVAVWGAIHIGGQLTRWLDRGGFDPVADTPLLNGQTLTAIRVVADLDGNCLVGINSGGAFIGRVGPSGNVTLISQDLSALGFIWAIAVDPGNHDVVYCLTQNWAAGFSRAWTTNTASTATAATVWTEITTGRPPENASCLAVSASGVAYAGMNVPPGSPALYALTGGTWTAQQAIGAPPYGSVESLAADPTDPNVLYAIFGGEDVYRLTLSAGTWQWQALAMTGMPEIMIDLYAVNVGSPGAPKVVLRATTPTRGVFESRADPAAADPTVDLYVRDNFLDLGWATPSPDWVVNPYAPTTQVYHWECADIKVDPAQPLSGTATFFQTDPDWDGVSPLDPIQFDELRELPLYRGAQARLHVQVHNRARAAASVISVWAVYCDASAHLQPLDTTASGVSFDFWSQFTAAGAIVPALPVDSPWQSVGPPQILAGIDVDHPRVASWQWTLPSTGAHQCVVTFVHSAAAAIGETTRYDVDEITPTNRQVGQKNLFVAPPPPRLGPLFRFPDFELRLNQPGPHKLPYRVELDLGGLPPGIELSFRTTVPPGGIDGAKRAGLLRELVLRLAGWARAPFSRGDGPVERSGGRLYLARGGSRVELRDLREPGALLLSLRAATRLEPGAEHRFSVVQRQDDELHGGGATYIVRTGGRRPAATLKPVEPDQGVTPGKTPEWPGSAPGEQPDGPDRPAQAES